MGIYVSGHPLEDDIERLERSVTAHTSDFVIDEETGKTKIHDRESCIIGGLISEMRVKLYEEESEYGIYHTGRLKRNRGSCRISKTVCDISVSKRRCQSIYQQGTTQIEEESKVICNQIISFEDSRQELWVQFMDKEAFLKKRMH